MTNDEQGMILTIGYQERTAEDFLLLLLEGGVDVVVDVRETAWSRRRAFSRWALEPLLDGHGIGYIHARFAGNPRHLRKAAKSHADCLAAFREHLADSPDVIGELDGLLSSLIEYGCRVCLLCYERHPADCHRSILLEAWAASSGKPARIKHLNPDGAVRFMA